jgi:hypothetical protein
MSEFNRYIRTNVAEMREVTAMESEVAFDLNGCLYSEHETIISISEEDKRNGSPKWGDMIARNPDNHRDQWLVAKRYFRDNFELTKTQIDGEQV